MYLCIFVCICVCVWNLPESPTMMYLKRYLYGRAARFLGGAAGAGADAPQPIFLCVCVSVCVCVFLLL